jgi:hypothetical protein
MEELTRDIQCPSNPPEEDSGSVRCDEKLDSKPGSYKVVSLHGMYEEVHRRAPNAKIVVLLYPHLFTDLPTRNNPNMTQRPRPGVSGPLVCEVGSRSGKPLNLAVREDTIVAFNKGVDQIDRIIVDEIAKARAHGVTDIVAADPRPAFSDGKWGGHGLCSSKEWINTVSVGPGTKKKISGPGPRPESYHPNKKGQGAFADAMLQVIRG